MTVPEPRGGSEVADARRAAGGDTEAFERLYRAHVARVNGLVCRMMGTEDAEDVTQEIFIRTWEKLDTFGGQSAFGTWLHRLAVNVILARRKRRSVQRQRSVTGEDLSGFPSRPARPEDRVDFERAVMLLPEGAREVFVLHDVEGYKHREIADMLDISAGTSKAQLHRARMALREHIER